ncbi:MAG: insulinase family protein, partial [Bacteroidales bacterium]|nr:insulinase family protein [Bacteroidales bacterium]
MKHTRFIFCFVALFALTGGSLMAQKTYNYKTYANDPLGVREYTLDNGLKVFMSVYKDAPKVQTYIAVRAGSRNDPHETTGLAHYLEHMMFKGTSRLGTTDWEKEKVLIQKIEDLFEAYRMFDDSLTRAAIYHKIDSLSYVASKIAIANEYDKAMTAIGSTGTNAFTSNDYTMYVENIPNNQIETWCEVQADRFQNLVLRLFHTELETIYEEKNMSLTKDNRKANEAMFAALFPHHPYGNQTTLGSQEHLKNPSMRNIRNFVATYYVPNNICISMAGDFDPDEAIKIIDKYWGNMKPSPVPELQFEREQPITSVITKTVTGLDAENTIRAYRLDSGNGSRDAMLADLLESVLNNGKCGLIDLNVNQKQRCMGAYAGTYTLNDYGAFMFGGQPLQGQTLADVQALFDEQIALVKQGKFDDWMLEADINNMQVAIMKRAESINSRASQMAYAFVEHRSWGDVCNEIDELSKITKKDIVDFANRLFKENNYVIVNKLQGEPEPILKVSKP